VKDNTSTQPSFTKQKARPVEKIVHLIFFLSAVLSVITTIAIVLVISTEAVSFFEKVTFSDFLFGTRWTPLLKPRSYGVLPLVNGTFLIVIGSAIVALPAGLATAIYMSEYASDSIRRVVKPVLEILAGIPTVVYGYFALTYVTPIMMSMTDKVKIFNAASASIVVGIMILPMVASLCDNALRSVPSTLRQGGYALGATHLEVTTRIVVPAGLSGVMASFVLALSRAIGETMAVTIAAGATPRITGSFFESVQTMTAYIVEVSLGDTPAGGIEYQTIFAVASLLFVITLAMNVGANIILNRFKEQYE